MEVEYTNENEKPCATLCSHYIHILSYNLHNLQIVISKYNLRLGVGMTLLWTLPLSSK